YRAVQDYKRYPTDWFWPALRPWRTGYAEHRARFFDHARRDEPDAERGFDDGLLPGVRQPNHHLDRRQSGAFRTERLQAGARLLHAAINPAARRRREFVHRE